MEGRLAALPTMDKGIEDEEYSPIGTNEMNYHTLVLTGTSAREELEDNLEVDGVHTGYANRQK
jgi:hypothetical protein